MNNDVAISENRIKTFRWYYYIALTQLALYFIVPIALFPARFIMDIETISALTLGLVVGMFFLIVSVLGLFVDRSRRKVYLISISAMALYFIWAIVSWAYIEHMDYLLR